MAAEPKLDQDFLNTILDTMADPLFVKDEDHRWIVVNQALCDLMGQRREDILGKSDGDFFPAEEAATFWKMDEEVFASGGVNINEEPITGADGETHIIVTKKTIFTTDDGERNLVGTIRDITDLKLAQDQLQVARDELELRVEQRTKEAREAQDHLRQAQKMEAVGQLTGGVAHDFNNLLAVILSCLELIRSDPEDHDTVRELALRAITACDRGANLTHRLLAFSRRQALQPTPTDVCALVRGIRDLLDRTIGEHVEIRTGPKVENCVARVDAAQLETAILNLSLNARDAMSDGGVLTLRVDSVNHETEVALSGDILPAGDYVIIEVTDTGCGMDLATVERVFEPFFTTKEVGQGSGLGLSMVYGFATQSGGGISVTSALERGTSVKILLPMIVAELVTSEAGVADPKPVQATGGGRRVLVVEDDPDVRKITVMLVEGMGFEVVEAGSGDEALELFPTMSDIDILLSDVVLPGGHSGPEFAEKAIVKRPMLKVVFMSGYTGGSLDPSWGRRGCQLLEKPFSLAELESVLQINEDS